MKSSQDKITNGVSYFAVGRADGKVVKRPKENEVGRGVAIYWMFFLDGMR